jgi:hypothetical protein
MNIVQNQYCYVSIWLLNFIDCVGWHVEVARYAVVYDYIRLLLKKIG